MDPPANARAARTRSPRWADSVLRGGRHPWQAGSMNTAVFQFSAASSWFGLCRMTVSAQIRFPLFPAPSTLGTWRERHSAEGASARSPCRHGCLLRVGEQRDNPELRASRWPSAAGPRGRAAATTSRASSDPSPCASRPRLCPTHLRQAALRRLSRRLAAIRATSRHTPHVSRSRSTSLSRRHRGSEGIGLATRSPARSGRDQAETGLTASPG